MNKSLLVLLFVAFTPLLGSAQQTEVQAVRAAVNQYFRGHATGAPGEMRKAFLPSAHIEGTREGKFVSWTAEEYSSRFTGRRPTKQDEVP